MDVRSKIEDYESALKARGIRLKDVLDRAGVDRSSWTRWKRKDGHLPTMTKWQAVEREMELTLERETLAAE